ncbi:non-ribosomal peptide synthetase [Chitinophaga sp. HK235]|uniref:non-ribosomal peptide synthetase n=1 Tax=Chitinophaga sp. HK235 TaxID=2952571 RepID=UPI001BAD6A96|nr:non-ribosomal peptide synthetase [Chitinophaga sp. HK235]
MMTNTFDKEMLLFSNKFLNQKEYWLKKLAAVEQPVRISIYGNNLLSATSTEELEWDISESLQEKIIKLSNNADLTCYIVMVASWKILLSRFLGQPHITVSSPVNRLKASEETFNRNLLLFDDLSVPATFRELLMVCGKTVIEAYDNQDYPLKNILDSLASPHLSPATNITISMDNIHDIALSDEPGNEIQIILSKQADKLKFRLVFCPEAYPEYMCRQLLRCWENVSAQLLADVNQPFKTIRLLPAEDQQQLIHQFEGRKTIFPADRLIPHYLEHHAASIPQNRAVSCNGVMLSYTELNEEVNKIAAFLKPLLEDRSAPVGLMLPRSIEMMQVILALWKCGVSYIPLDTTYPHTRIVDILSDAGSRVLITRSDFMIEPFDLSGGTVICMDKVADTLENMFAENPQIGAATEDLAYIIYTSGSTGKPKGVMVEHAGMMNHMFAKINDLALTSESIVAQNASHTFDISVWQFFVSIVTGGCTVIYPTETNLDINEFVNQVVEDRISILEVVPSYLSLICDTQEQRMVEFPHLTYLLATGEAFPHKLASRWFASNPGVPVVNAYGPTEASDDITHCLLIAPPEDQVIPIGRPVQNMSIYVVDEYMNICPVGVKGEILVAGIGVCRGYINNPEKTAEVFLQDPFSKTTRRMYRTGDLGSYRNDGQLDFWGRKDFQLKIRGYRIEPGEIENALLKISVVKEAVVIDHTTIQGHKYLCGYITVSDTADTDVDQIQTELSLYLPEYMLPTNIHVLSKFPLTTNGKIDRKALAELEFQSEGAELPQTREEEVLLNIWKEALSLERLGVTDNFFRLGGHSVAAIQVMSRIKKHFKADLVLLDIFENPTIRNLAGVIRQKEGSLLRTDETGDIPVKALKEYYEISPVQYPEWYMLRLNPKSTFYNVGMVLEMKGAVNTSHLLQALNILINRHEIFRAAFLEIIGKPHVSILDELNISMDDFLIDISGSGNWKSSLEKILGEVYKKPLDLSKAPVATFKLIRIEKEQHIFVFEINHIIWDQLSTFIFFRELQQLYNQLQNGSQPELQPLAVNYFDWSEWMHARLSDGSLDHHKVYWLQKFEVLPLPLELPLDFPRSVKQTFNGRTIYQLIDDDTRKELTRFHEANNTTLQILLLSVLKLMLFRITGQNDIVVGTPIFNREHASLESIVGLFASAIPIRSRVDDSATFQQLLDQVREVSLEAYDHHSYPFNKVLELLKHTGDFSKSRFISVFFGVQHDETSFEKLAYQFDGVEVKMYEPENVQLFEEDTSVFDFTMQLDHTADYMKLSIRYNTDLFLEETANNFLRWYLTLLKQVLKTPSGYLKSFLLEETPVVAMGENLTLPDVSLTDLITDNMARHRTRCALVQGTTEYSFEDIQHFSGKVASYLQRKRIGKGDKVGVLLQPSFEMIGVVMGIMKAGATLIPLSKEYPANRINVIMETVELADVFYDENILSAEVLALLSDKYSNSSQKWPELAGMNPEFDTVSWNDNDVVYIIFTSGSTGIPKAIEVRHQGLLNIMLSTQQQYKLTNEDSVLFHTSLVFDAVMLEIFLPLLSGARIIVLDTGSRNIQLLGECINRNRVTFIQFVPLLLDEFVTAAATGIFEYPASLRYVVCGGAILTTALRDRFFNVFRCGLFNHYGPTEITIDAASYNCSQRTSSDIMPVGRPVANTAIYIVDRHMNICAPNIAGEVMISSLGLAKGYYGNTIQTDSAFISNPFGDGLGDRLYRTGDKGVLLSDGNLVILGRMDNQVKLNGNRIELDEVETALLKIPGVHNAAAIVTASGNAGEMLTTAIQLDDACTVLSARKDNALYMYTLAQRPELKKYADALHTGAWPEYFKGATVIKNCWHKLYQLFPELQLVITDEQGTIAGVGNAVPIRWNGLIADLPCGWDDALEKGVMYDGTGEKPDTLVILAGVSSKSFSWAGGVSRHIIDGFKKLASREGFKHLLVALRPIDKLNKQEVPIETYASLRDIQGRSEDKWIRLHESIGGTIIATSEKSQHVDGSLVQWEGWTGVVFENDGSYFLKDTLQAVQVDLTCDRATYYDPCVWIDHSSSLTAPDLPNLTPLNVRRRLQQLLPSYMIPARIVMVDKIPMLESGKNNKTELLSVLPSGNEEMETDLTSGQEKVLRIFLQVLETDKLSPNANFFEAGGHSIRAIRLMGLLLKEFGTELTLEDIFLNPSVMELDQCISRKKNSSK